MQKLDYILKLFEAKGWYLYEGKPGQPFDTIISCGRASTIEHGAFYHIIPASARHDDPAEVKANLADALEKGSIPKYDDKVKQGNIHGIHLDDANISFVSNTDSFVFPLEQTSNVEDAIKFNISSYNVHYFGSINEIVSFLKASKISAQKPIQLPAQLRWTFVTRDEDPTHKAIVPESPSNILFRGQVARHEPCFSTATRGVDAKATMLNELNDRDQARLILNYVRTQWFVDLLRQTPPLRWMNEQNLFIDEVAVAQHYGLPTGYIDLTQSFEVAAFFACCRYDGHSKHWEPAASGEGVIYVIDWRNAAFRGAIRPIHLQVFPRPSEQWGWTHGLRLGQDFDKLPYVTKLIFKHDAGLSAKILQQLEQGDALFPPDPLSMLAEGIMNSKVAPRVTAAEVAQDFISDPRGLPGRTVENVLDMIARETGMTFSDTAISIGIEQIDAEMEKLWDRRKANFFESVGIRLEGT